MPVATPRGTSNTISGVLKLMTYARPALSVNDILFLVQPMPGIVERECLLLIILMRSVAKEHDIGYIVFE
jgi:hypothetical protein